MKEPDNSRAAQVRALRERRFANMQKVTAPRTMSLTHPRHLPSKASIKEIADRAVGIESTPKVLPTLGPLMAKVAKRKRKKRAAKRSRSRRSSRPASSKPSRSHTTPPKE